MYKTSGTEVSKNDQNATAIRQIDTDMSVDQRQEILDLLISFIFCFYAFYPFVIFINGEIQTIKAAGLSKNIISSAVLVKPSSITYL